MPLRRFWADVIGTGGRIPRNAQRSPLVDWPAECASMRRRPVLVRQQTLRTLESILSADRSARHLFHARNMTVPVRLELFEEPRDWPSETVNIA